MDIHQKAKELWEHMNKSERFGVRFGMFPAEIMQEAEKGGYDGRQLVLALMDISEKEAKVI